MFKTRVFVIVFSTNIEIFYFNEKLLYLKKLVFSTLLSKEQARFSKKSSKNEPVSHGGGGGNRTPVRKHFNGTFSGRRRLLRESSSLFPSQAASRHAVCSGESHDAWAGQLFPASRTPHKRRLPRPVASPVQTAAFN